MHCVAWPKHRPYLLLLLMAAHQADPSCNPHAMDTQVCLELAVSAPTEKSLDFKTRLIKCLDPFQAKNNLRFEFDLSCNTVKSSGHSPVIVSVLSGTPFLRQTPLKLNLCLRQRTRTVICHRTHGVIRDTYIVINQS